VTSTKPKIDAALRARVLEALHGRSIVLVGLMGCGKSTVGRRLAVALDLDFVDADSEIEVAAGKSIPEIFKEDGEPFFRDRERMVISRLLSDGPRVLATGGGAYMDAETRENIAQSGISVWIKADLATLVRRVKKRGNRPLLQQGDVKAKMSELMEQRYPVYGGADVAVDSRDVSHDVVAREIIEGIDRYLDCTSEPASARSRAAQ
jgi:shikimate kinase